MWSRKVGTDCRTSGPLIVAVNPKSFLGSKMVKDAYVAGGDISQGADILVKAAISDEFAQAYGEYFDNDIEALRLHIEMLSTMTRSVKLKTMKVIAMQSIAELSLKHRGAILIKAASKNYLSLLQKLRQINPDS